MNRITSSGEHTRTYIDKRKMYAYPFGLRMSTPHFGPKWPCPLIVINCAIHYAAIVNSLIVYISCNDIMHENCIVPDGRLLKTCQMKIGEGSSRDSVAVSLDLLICFTPRTKYALLKQIRA